MSNIKVETDISTWNSNSFLSPRAPLSTSTYTMYHSLMYLADILLVFLSFLVLCARPVLWHSSIDVTVRELAVYELPKHTNIITLVFVPKYIKRNEYLHELL